MKISRRSFLFGGTASVLGAGVVLSGCNHKIGDQQSGNSDAIKCMLVDYFDKFEYAGTNNPTIASVGWHIFEGLYDINIRSNETYPALATSKPAKVDDLTYEVTLRKDAKYSNDSKVMAGDVIYSFKAAKQKAAIGFLLDFIDTVEAVGNDKVRFKLKRNMDGVLEERLSLVKIEPANASDVDKQKAPIGTGPYTIVSMDGSIGGSVEFAPNANYNGNLELPKNPMVWTINGDSSARAGAIKGGGSHVSEDIPLDKIYELRDDGDDVEFVEGFENACLFFKATKAPFNNKIVRQAIFYALDTNRIVEEKMQGHAQPSTCYLGSSNKNYHQASTVFKYDPEKSKDLLSKGRAENLKINFVFDKNCWAYKFKDIIIENLEDVGIECNDTDTEFRWNDIDEKLKNLNYDICMTTIERSFHGANADFILNSVFVKPDYMERHTEYSISDGNKLQEIRGLIDQAAGLTGSEQQKVYNQAFDLIADECPIYPFIHREQVTAFNSKKVSGFTPISTGGLYLLGTELVK